MVSTSISKWLAYVIILAMLLFIPIALFLPDFIDRFTQFITTIIAIVAGVGVVYIIIKMKS